MSIGDDAGGNGEHTFGGLTCVSLLLKFSKELVLFSVHRRVHLIHGVFFLVDTVKTLCDEGTRQVGDRSDPRRETTGEVVAIFQFEHASNNYVGAGHTCR